MNCMSEVRHHRAFWWEARWVRFVAEPVALPQPTPPVSALGKSALILLTVAAVLGLAAVSLI
jgi:hypothetical protein